MSQVTLRYPTAAEQDRHAKALAKVGQAFTEALRDNDILVWEEILSLYANLGIHLVGASMSTEGDITYAAQQVKKAIQTGAPVIRDRQDIRLFGVNDLSRH